MPVKIKPAQATLNELRDGQVMLELAQAIHDAAGAARDMRKPATVTLTLTFETLKTGTQGLKEAPMIARAEVATKLPKAEAPTTLFYMDEDDNPTRHAPAREQSELSGFSVVANPGDNHGGT